MSGIYEHDGDELYGDGREVNVPAVPPSESPYVSPAISIGGLSHSSPVAPQGEVAEPSPVAQGEHKVKAPPMRLRAKIEMMKAIGVAIPKYLQDAANLEGEPLFDACDEFLRLQHNGYLGTTDVKALRDFVAAQVAALEQRQYTLRAELEKLAKEMEETYTPFSLKPNNERHYWSVEETCKHWAKRLAALLSR